MSKTASIAMIALLDLAQQRLEPNTVIEVFPVSDMTARVAIYEGVKQPREKGVSEVGEFGQKYYITKRVKYPWLHRFTCPGRIAMFPLPKSRVGRLGRQLHVSEVTLSPTTNNAF